MTDTPAPFDASRPQTVEIAGDAVSRGAAIAALCTGPNRMANEVRLRALPAVGQWRAMDSAPKDGTEFAAYELGEVYRCSWKGYDDGEDRFYEGWFDHLGNNYENPTAWMPLPPTPISVEEGTDHG